MMLCNISQLNELFIDNQIKVVNVKLNEIIKNYSFIYLSDTNEINQNTEITQKINDSKLLVINYYKSIQEKINLHFIIGFKKTILIIQQPLFFSAFNSLISINNELEVCFLSDTKNLFEQFVKLKYNESESNSYLNEEISKFNQNLLIPNSKLFNKFWKNISSCISGYLIKRSYYKLDKNRIKSFNSQEQVHPKKFSENEYIDLRSIGITSTCVVELYYHIQNEELHIIKKVNCIESNESSKLLNRELSNYSSIKHPFLPIFYGQIQGKNYPVIEFINGKDLFEIELNRLSKEEKFEIILQIMSVIMYLHKNNFIYRDLKPNNIMIDKQKTIILIDFDRMIKNDDEVNTIDFAHQYAAPEINSADITKKVDIYSIGQVMYYILNGKNPNDIKPPSFVEFEEYPGIKTIYYKCINKDINERPNIIELTNDIITYITSEEIDVRNIYSEDCLKIGFSYFYQEKLKKSVQYFTLASDQNNPDAQYFLGSIYKYGMHIEQDSNKTAYLLQLANKKSFLSQLIFNSICEKENIIKQDTNKSIYYYELAANQNHPMALFNLAQIYSEGKYVPQNIDKFIHYLKLAANQNYPDALYNLGLLYYTGKYVRRDIKQSIQYFTSAANKNHAMAQYNLGLIYYDGKCITRDIDQAINYFSLASNNGHLSDAQNSLGLIYYENRYIERDINKSIHYLKLAADQDNPKAQYNLGIIYYDGTCIKRDINESIKYLTFASNHDLNEAHFALGFIFSKGKYIGRNIDKAIHYFTLAAKQNNINAQLHLGVIYYEGKYIVRDINKAVYFLTLAANQNDPYAQFCIGEIYFEGRYIKRDISKGIYYFTLSSNQDKSYAQFRLGLIYYKGQFVPQNITKAIHYFTSSANQNDRFAQFYLGFIYLLDENVKQDIEKSIHYFTLSAIQNHPISQYALGFFYFTGLYVQQNIYKGIDYIMQSSNNGFDKANFFLGFQYHEGKYVKRDMQKSIHFYKEASSFNNSHAKNNLGIIYKNGFGDEIQKNVKWATVYFKEAIQFEDSFLSMYNLAHTYIFDKKTQKAFDKSIDLLIKSEKDFYPSLKLLSLVLVEKHGVDCSKIQNELKKRINYSNDLLHRIIKTAKYLKLDDSSILQKEFNDCKEIDFVFGSSFDFIISKDLFDSNQNDNKNYVTNNKFNINSDFYDGFGHDI